MMHRSFCGPFPGRRRRRPSDGASASPPALGAPGARVRPATSAHHPRPVRSLPASPPQPLALRGEGPGTRVRGGSPGESRVGSGGVRRTRGGHARRRGGRGRGGLVGRRRPAVWGSVTGGQRRGLRPSPGGRGRRGRRRGGGRAALPAPPRPLLWLPPIQVPSASRRGGLKTPGGPRPSALGRGGRARGESGGLALLPQTPPRRAGAPRRAAPRRRRGGRREGASPAAVVSSRARAGVCAPPRPRARREPPGACGVSEHGPAGPVPDAPSSNLPASRSLVSLCLSGRPEAPSGDVPCQGRALPPPCGGTPPFKLVRLLAVDHSARASMKNAASCEN